MSSTLIYDRLFIKVADNLVIPMLLAGESNLYTGYGRYEKRLKDWGNDWRYDWNDNGAVNPKLYMEALKKRIPIDYRYIDSYKFKSITNPFTVQQFYRYFENGFKNAKTIEEIIETTFFNVLDITICKKRLFEPVSGKKSGFIVTTTDEIMSVLSSLSDDEWIYCKFPGDSPVKRRPTSPIDVDKFDDVGEYVIKKKNYYLMSENQYSPDIFNAKVFNSYQEASSFILTSSILRYGMFNLRITKKPKTHAVYYMIKIFNNYYFIKFSHGRLIYGCSGKKILNESSANKIIEKINKLYGREIATLEVVEFKNESAA